MDGKRSRKARGPRARLVKYEGRPIGIRWRLGDQKGEISSGTMDRDTAIGEMALLLRDLANGILPCRETEGPHISWSDFRMRYEVEHLVGLSPGAQSGWTTAANHLERVIHPKRLSDVTKAAMSKLQGELSSQGLSPASVSSYIGTIRAAIGWAYDMDLVESLPRYRTRKGLIKRSGMRSRPIIGEELDRILEAAKIVRPRGFEAWQHFILGLWHSSLRVDELRRLSWDQKESLSINTEGKYPMIRMYAEGHKSRRDCFQPITKEFWELISKPGVVRRGLVFPLPGRNGQQMTVKRVIRVISEIGKRAVGPIC